MALLALLAELLVAVVVSPASQDGHLPSSPTAILAYLSEQCHRPPAAADLVHDQVHFVPRDVVCGKGGGESGDTLAALISRPGARVIASPEPALCEPLHWLAHVRDTRLVTWTCPQESRFESRQQLRLAPPVQDIARALAAVVHDMRWKNVAILHADVGWWQSLAHAVDSALRRWNLVYRHLVPVSAAATLDDLVADLDRLRTAPCRAILVCASADPVGLRILEAVDRLQLSERHESLSILVDVATVPAWLPAFARESTTVRAAAGQHTKKYVLLFGETTVANRTDETMLDDRLGRALAALADPETSFATTSFTLLDLRDDDSWRPLMRVRQDNGTAGVATVDRLADTFEEWVQKHDADEDDGDNGGNLPVVLRTAQVLLVFLCSSLFVAVIVGATALARNRLLKNRISKGPYKVLLTAADFVFPQVTDTRRVDEGIEAMLCCWLQQLQEFGGPEVDKPDLLKGSVGSLKGHGGVGGAGPAGSGGSMTRALLVDPRVRYNGDLVQMKLLSSPGGGGVHGGLGHGGGCGHGAGGVGGIGGGGGGGSGGGFELKTKALETLLLIHGLRHENLNPVIGCLTEPSRPALVWEWCSRGSLEDVLVMDEIKLDWSFRLSLLTDLVRGMKYLHSTPLKVHGYLTSRNCVIDARWVLKLTDYGLPSFYEAQGIVPPSKTARELLWTAPELLRHVGLRKKGTQPGDVYSFGIIMQEVVVRGEPFCMLALTPEEIIEKVKRPPPLIRPSVSKGAAPPEAINIMRQCWAEQAEMRPDFNAVHDLFKKLNHGRKVNFVDTMFQMLEKYSNNLEELIRERTSQLDMEKKKTEQLLNRMLPSSVAEKLKLGMPVDPEEFAEVTIYFSDIVGFTTISAFSTPFQVVDLLNDLYTCFDATINAYNVYKVETIGDAYMVVGGLPVRIADHAEQIATMALDLLHQSGKFKIRHLPRTPLRLRIGLHTGPCCAGVVGLTMPRYCLFGDTVNTASRMESTGSPWRIHLSHATRDRLEAAGGYRLEHRGPIEVKGKGCMHTYWLLGKTGFDKHLPEPPPVGETSHGLAESLVRAESDEEAAVNRLEETGPVEVKVSAHVHEEQQQRRTFQTLEAAKLLQASPPPSVDPPKDATTFMRAMESSRFATIPNSDVEFPACVLTKSTSSDAHMASLGTPVSSTDASLLCAATSTTSLSAAGSTAAAAAAAAVATAAGFRNRHRRVGVIEEDDLSTPYNHYRCLSPIDRADAAGKASGGAGRGGLRRQYSVDRGDDPGGGDAALRPLHKQNSSGTDLEMIEEVPAPPPPQETDTPGVDVATTRPCPVTVSVESLPLH